MTASLAVNPANRGQARLHVLDVTGMAIVRGRVEVEVGRRLDVGIRLQGRYEDRDVNFQQCHSLPIDVGVQDKFFNISELLEADGEPCAAVGIQGSRPGFSVVSARYVIDDRTIEDSVVVSAFRPLR